MRAADFSISTGAAFALSAFERDRRLRFRDERASASPWPGNAKPKIGSGLRSARAHAGANRRRKRCADLENIHAAEVSIEELQYIGAGSVRHRRSRRTTARRRPTSDIRSPECSTLADDPPSCTITLDRSPPPSKGARESVVGASNVRGVCRGSPSDEGNRSHQGDAQSLSLGRIAKDDTGAGVFRRGRISSDAFRDDPAASEAIERLPAS